ncbi:MAG: TIR domain-containing protein [Xanthomonadales bacterium]|nr:TIR domain-containing protein [Xanthomonadales bacterium]
MTQNNNANPRVFISYSWDSPEHKLWVESFAQELRKSGIDARLDAWRDESQSIDDFMMIELERADFVIAVCTPQYKQKIVANAEGTATASGFEMGTAAALRRAGSKDIIPVLRSGDWLQSAPSSLVSYRFYDFTSDDISAEFSQLRDRILGYVKRPPELGARSGPAAAPELPDIFEGGPTPEPVQTAPPPTGDAPRSAPPPSSGTAPPAGTPGPGSSGSGIGKKLLWGGVGAVAVIVLLMLIPTGEEAGTESAPQMLQDTPLMDQQGTLDDEQDAAGTVDQWADDSEEFVSEAPEAPQYTHGDIISGWAYTVSDSACLLITQLATQTWLAMAYDAGMDVYILQAYDPNWEGNQVGDTNLVVTELDGNQDSAYLRSGQTIEDGGVPGIQLEFDSDEFLWSLGDHSLISFFWHDDQESHREFWVMDANLRGAGVAAEALAQCAERF